MSGVYFMNNYNLSRSIHRMQVFSVANVLTIYNVCTYEKQPLNANIAQKINKINIRKRLTMYNKNAILFSGKGNLLKKQGG